jgi:hypothetical protein
MIADPDFLHSLNNWLQDDYSFEIWSRIALGDSTGHFIISVITNIYNRKTKVPILMKLFTSTGKLKNVLFWQPEIFDVCTTGDMAHIDTIFKFLPHTRQRHGSLQQWRISMHPCWRVFGKKLNIVSMCVVSHVVHTSNIFSCQKNFFGFPVAVNSSIKVGPLVFLL